MDDDERGGHLVNRVLLEAMEEASGRSSKRWALVLVAMLAGGVLALVLSNRLKQRRARPTDLPPEPVSPS